eukprot:Nitzschia sp. Nitz4//scaffold75_size92586//87654//89943//NITZ4_004872-RA/size92586-augustus-gene-0.84-mRNA-1//1//CDS//3329557756//3642//frame0
MTSKSPTGIEILKGKKQQWRIGAKIGDGACAAVYELEAMDGSNTGYAAKVAPLAVKGTSKKNSPVEVNDRLLNHEAVTYQNQFPDIQGKFIPHLPPGSGPPAHGTANGFRYLIMERMDAPLYEVVPQLLGSAKKSDKFIDLGPICVQLLRCIEAIHTRRHVFVDVKPENFMLTFPGTKAPKKGTTVAQNLAARVRILDLAMVQLWVSAYSSHRSNESTSGVVGTPLFASLNVHRGETPSRRDDLEALGYVILDLILKVTFNSMSKELPWSKGGSDDEIAALKADVMDDKKHSLWKKDLGGAKVVDTFLSYMDTVRLYTYKKVPDYDELAEVLGQLQVPISGKSSSKSGAAPKKRSTSRSTVSTADSVVASNKRVTRSRATDAAENPTPKKIPRDETFMEVEYLEPFMEPTSSPNADHESDDDSFGTARMSLDGENADPTERTPVAAEKGLTLTVTSGPHKGVSVDLIKGVCETLVVGRNPQTTAKALGFGLPDDSSLADSHVKLELSIRGKLTAVVVKDLKAAGGTSIGSSQIPAGKDSKAMRGQTIKIGETCLSVGSLQPKEMFHNDTPNAPKNHIKTQEVAPAKSTRRTRGAKTPDTQAAPDVAEAVVPQRRLQRRGLAVFVKAGPHQGETYEMEAGQVEAINIGANPTGTNGTMVALNKDKSLKATHLRMELMMMKQNKLKAIDIIDKSKGDTKVNKITISNKSRVFTSDEIKIGDSVLVIKQLE